MTRCEGVVRERERDCIDEDYPTGNERTIPIERVKRVCVCVYKR